MSEENTRERMTETRPAETFTFTPEEVKQGTKKRTKLVQFTENAYEELKGLDNYQGVSSPSGGTMESQKQRASKMAKDISEMSGEDGFSVKSMKHEDSYVLVRVPAESSQDEEE